MDAELTLGHIVGFLLETPIFSDLEPAGLADIVGIMQVQRLRPGQVIFRQGDAGDAWYVIYDGAVDVLHDGISGRVRPVARLVARACFGEMAVLDGSTRSATVRSSRDTVLFRFPRGPFQELLDEGNLAAYQLVLGMARVLSERQRRLTAEIHGLLDDAERQVDEGEARMRELVDRYR
ncbi:MAG: cyclic nucleotide-binding domain-containing protein, partial [Deltaproteobacteria bacterium]